MKKSLKSFAAAIITTAALTGTLFTGCSKKTEDTINFGITMGPGTIRTSIVILADKLGYFAEEGLKVNFREVAGIVNNESYRRR